MFVRQSGLTGAIQVPHGPPRPAGFVVFGAALAVASLAGPARGQTPPSTSPSPSGSASPAGPPGGYPPSTPPSYPPPAPSPGYPPNGAQQGQPPPPQQPNYGQPAGFGGYTEPPLPPPPRRSELSWSIRFQMLDLLFGRATGEVEYAFAGPFSVVLMPEYVFANPGQDRAYGVTASGGGLAGELGFWVEGRPLRGYFLKAHAGYRSIKFKSSVDEVSVPATQIGAMFGSQSIYGGWFTLSGGFGVVYDFQSQDRAFAAIHPTGGPVRYTIGASGLFGNGFDLLSQLAIGGSF